jgi:hypothetical protein
LSFIEHLIKYQWHKHQKYGIKKLTQNADTVCPSKL